MTPARLAACLATIGWSRRELGRRLGLEAGRPEHWAQGRRPIPPAVTAWLEALAAEVARHPAPQVRSISA